MSDKPGPGATIAGRYRLERSIGEGGHGIVYRAIDSNVGRPVAVKVLHGNLPREAGLEARFEREAMLARSLNHPNTVRLLDFGRDPGGALFIAYELLEGQPLDAAIAAGPLAPERVARIGKQVLKSLMEAHGAGVIHRDIKPSNIFLCDFSGETDFVKVLDFGIAKATAADHSLTQTGFVVGTPSYMAPEQVRGSDVTAATDLYALGLVLAEALTGQVVVDGSTGAVIAAAQLGPEPVPLPPAVLQSQLGPIIHRAVQKPLERRYASGREMLADLDGVAVVSSAPIPVTDRVSFGLAPTGVVTVAPATPPAFSPAPPVHAPASVTMPSPNFGSPVPAPFVAPMYAPRPTKSSGGIWIGLFALAALVTIVGAGIFVFAVAARTDTDTTESSSDRQGGKSKKKKSPEPKPEQPRTKLASMSIADIATRLESDGWNVVEKNEVQTGRLSYAVIQRDGRTGTVVLHDDLSEASEGAQRGVTGSALQRDGKRVLQVIFGDDASLAKQVLEFILNDAAPQPRPKPESVAPAPQQDSNPGDPLAPAPTSSPRPTPRPTSSPTVIPSPTPSPGGGSEAKLRVRLRGPHVSYEVLAGWS